MKAPIRAIMVIGQTCSGKERLSLALAEKLNSEIISMDSMKIYREMNIGTAKASKDDQKRIKHHMIDIINPDQDYNVSQYVNAVSNIAIEMQNQNKTPLFSGGTPLYAKALFSGLFELPKISESYKKQAETDYDMNKENAYQKLSEIDPIAVKRIHLNDRQRVTRALEVYYATGKPISTLQQQFSNDSNQYKFITIGVRWARDILHKRIEHRVHQMIEMGLEQEAKAIFNKYEKLGVGASKAVGYQEFFPYFQQKSTKEQAIEKIIINTRQLCKHQMTWMRKLNINWFEMNPQKTSEQLFEEVLTFVKQNNFIQES